MDPTRPATPQPFTPVPPEPYPVQTTPVSAPPPVVAQPTATPVARKKSGGGWLNFVLILAAAFAIGGVAFAVGRSTAPVAATAGSGRNGTGNGNGFPNASVAPRASGQPGFGRGGFGGGLGSGGLTINGTVESVNGNTMTIRTASGQTIEVATDDSTTYHTQAPASAADVQAGETVQVQVDFAGGGRPGAGGTTSGPVGTAGSVTVVP